MNHIHGIQKSKKRQKTCYKARILEDNVLNDIVPRFIPYRLGVHRHGTSALWRIGISTTTTQNEQHTQSDLQLPTVRL